MRAALLLVVLLSGCAARLDAPHSACSDPLGLYTASVYEPCCKAHDEDYAIGGIEDDRKAADARLYRCVARWSEDDAASMYYAVRAWGRFRFHYTKGTDRWTA